MPDNLLSPEYGLSNARLQECNASPSDVRSGKTFYSGDKNKKTGNLVNHGSITDVVSVKRANDQSLGDRAFIRIQPGIYTTNASSGYPEVSIPFDDMISQLGILDYILKATSVSVGWKALAYNSGRYQVDFSVSANKVYLVVAQCGTMDGYTAFTEMGLNPSHKELIFYQKDYTQDHVYMNSSIKVCVFKALASGKCYAAGVASGDRAVSFVGIWKLVP